MPNRFSQFFWGMLAIAIALVIAGISGSLALRNLRRAGDDVTVTGSARRPIRSDFVVWRGTVTGQSPTLGQAYRELEGNASRVRAFFAAQNIPDSLITYRPVETYQIPEIAPSGRETGRTVGYRLSQMFELRSPDIEGITRLSQASSALISEGVPFTGFAPEYLFTGLAEMRIEMLAEATRDARARAQVIAESAGGRIAGVRSARMGVFQLTPRNSTDVSDYGIYDTSSIEKDLTAVVRVTFGVDAR